MTKQPNPYGDVSYLFPKSKPAKLHRAERIARAIRLAETINAERLALIARFAKATGGDRAALFAEHRRLKDDEALALFHLGVGAAHDAAKRAADQADATLASLTTEP